MLYPTLSEVRKLAAQYSTIPVCWEVPADHWSPLQLFGALAQEEEQAFLLESINTPDDWQDWSYIGAGSQIGVHEPSDGSCAHCLITPAGEKKIYTIAPEHAATGIIRDMNSPRIPEMPEFVGGFVTAPCTAGCKRAFWFYRELVAYNHRTSTARIIINLQRDADLGAQYQAAEVRAAELATKIERYRLAPQVRDDAPPIAVEGEGTALRVYNAPNSFELYRRLRHAHPAPYLFYIRCGGEELAGLSHTLVENPWMSDYSGVGFGSSSSILKLCIPQISVRHRSDNTEIFASTPQEAQSVLELMRSAKLENHNA